MGFGIQILTSQGAQLLRDAKKASKKIVFTRAVASSNYDMDSRGDLAMKPLSWYDGASGTIAAVSNDLGFLQVSTSFSAVENGVDPVKSVCICAQIAKSEENPEYDPADDVIFAACSDDNSGHISGIAFSVDFALPISMSSMVDSVGNILTNAGISVVSFTPGVSPADGVLQVKLADGKVIDIAANEHGE